MELELEGGGQRLEARTSRLVDWRKFEDHLWFTSLALATPQPCLAGTCLPPGRARGGIWNCSATYNLSEVGCDLQLTTSKRLVVMQFIGLSPCWTDWTLCSELISVGLSTAVWFPVPVVFAHPIWSLLCMGDRALLGSPT